MRYAFWEDLSETRLGTERAWKQEGQCRDGYRCHFHTGHQINVNQMCSQWAMCWWSISGQVDTQRQMLQWEA